MQLTDIRTLRFEASLGETTDQVSGSDSAARTHTREEPSRAAWLGRFDA